MKKENFTHSKVSIKVILIITCTLFSQMLLSQNHEIEDGLECLKSSGVILVFEDNPLPIEYHSRGGGILAVVQGIESSQFIIYRNYNEDFLLQNIKRAISIVKSRNWARERDSENELVKSLKEKFNQ